MTARRPAPISGVVRAIETIGTASLPRWSEIAEPDPDPTSLKNDLLRSVYQTLLTILIASRGQGGEAETGEVDSDFSLMGSTVGPWPHSRGSDCADRLLPSLQTWLAGSVAPEKLGLLYEALLAYEPAIDERGFTLAPGTGRRRTGSFYTPPVLIAETIERALRPTIQERLTSDPANAEQALLALRVCDPAAGGGFFLLGAARVLGQALATVRAGCREPDAVTIAQARSDVIQHCLFGLDRDPLAVAICRSALWLEAGGLPPAILESRIVCADSLLADRTTLAGSESFDVVLSNPPYGTIADRQERQRVIGRFPTARSSGNAAIAFLELAMRLLGPGGRLGLVVPRSLTYSGEWSAIRQTLLPGLTSLTTVGHGFEGVNLEQVIVCARRQSDDLAVHREVGRTSDAGNTRAKPRVGVISPASPAESSRIDKDTWRRSDIWSAPPTAVESAILAKIAHLPRLGTLTRIARGIRLDDLGIRSDPIQPSASSLQPSHQAVSVPIHSQDPLLAPVYGGAEIGVLRLQPARAMVTPPLGAKRLLVPKVLTQNIVAHVKRPRPHVWLKAAIDPYGLTLPLDTVNWVIPTADVITLIEIAALISSRYASWYASRFVFAGAQRTMHLDSAYLGRIPVPDFRRTGAIHLVTDPSALVGRIDAIVYDALGLDEGDIREIDSYFP